MRLLEIGVLFFACKVGNCIVNIPRKLYNYMQEDFNMNKTYSMSIRVRKQELEKLKKAARLEAYTSYSEYERRIALIDATKVNAENDKVENKNNRII